MGKAYPFNFSIISLKNSVKCLIIWQLEILSIAPSRKSNLLYKRKNGQYTDEPRSSLSIIQIALLVVRIGLGVLALFLAIGFVGMSYDALFDDIHVFVDPFEIDMSEYETYKLGNGVYDVGFYGDKNAVILVDGHVVVNTYGPSPHYTHTGLSNLAEVRLIDGDHTMKVSPLEGAGKITVIHSDKIGSLVGYGIALALCIGFMFGLYKAD